MTDRIKKLFLNDKFILVVKLKAGTKSLTL